MPKYTGGQIVANYLMKEGVTHMFGVAGHGILGLLDAGYDYQDRLKMVMVRHEQVAGFMADGYYRVSHKPAATFTSSGPGSINILIALAEAMSDSVPFFSISGDVATQQWNSGALQELYRQRECDFPSVVRHYVKQTWQVTRLDMLPKVLALAFKTMMSGRRGPVNVDVPYDKFVETADVDLLRAGGVDAVGQQPGAWAIRPPWRRRWTCCSARRGRSSWPATACSWPRHGTSCAIWRTDLGIPVITSALAKGVIPEDDPLALGAAGAFGTYPANEIARSADVILALGCRFSDLHTSSLAARTDL